MLIIFFIVIIVLILLFRTAYPSSPEKKASKIIKISIPKNSCFLHCNYELRDVDPDYPHKANVPFNYLSLELNLTNLTREMLIIDKFFLKYTDNKQSSTQIVSIDNIMTNMKLISNFSQTPWELNIDLPLEIKPNESVDVAIHFRLPNYSREISCKYRLRETENYSDFTLTTRFNGGYSTSIIPIKK